MAAVMFVLLLFSIIPRDDVVRESVDLLHVSHFYDENGRLVFDQLIFWQWDEWYENAELKGRYNVQAWRLMKNEFFWPMQDWDVGGYKAMWQDGEVIRCVHAKHFREDWLQYDVELVEREVFPKEQRRELKSVDRPKGETRATNPNEFPGVWFEAIRKLFVPNVQ